MRTLPTKGIPPRGSAQDLIATEMLLRERNQKIASQLYLARMLQASLGIPEQVFKVWTELFALEVSQQSYSPEMIALQRKALKKFDRQTQQEKRDRRRMFSRLAKLEVEQERSRPASKAEREEFKRKLRRKRLQKGTS